MFSCEYCKIFKNNYFEEHPRTAASEVRINPKWNLRKQVFFKADVLKYSLKATERHLYWSDTLWNHEQESMKIMNVLHKLTLSTSKMAEGAKQDVHIWKETVFFYLIIDFSACLWHAKKDIIYAWIVHRWIVNRWIVYRGQAQPKN